MDKYVYILQLDGVNINYSLYLEHITALYEIEYDGLFQELGSPIYNKQGFAIFQKSVIDGSTSILKIAKEKLI